MKKRRIGRNNLCPCGSGKKYKNCCLPKNTKTGHIDFDQRVNTAMSLSLEHDEKSISEAITQFLNLMSEPKITEQQRLNVLFGLAKAYQHHGDHRAALKTLSSVDIQAVSKQGHNMEAYAKHLKATSLSALGENDEACILFNEALDDLNRPDGDPTTRAIVEVEAGKAFAASGDRPRAKRCWEAALEFFKEKKDFWEMYLRAKANLGYMLLDEADESSQEEGVRVVEAVSNEKARIGDLEGLANSYCNLALYFWKKRKYERAIAFSRKDLYLSRKIGDKTSIAVSLCNLSVLYLDLKQLSSARKILEEAWDIAHGLEDASLKTKIAGAFELVERRGRELSSKNETIGPLASCACQSGKTYKDCCGRADFEPVELPYAFDGIADELKPIEEEMSKVGKEPSPLDFIFRKIDESQVRLCWTHLEIHDGWMSLSELPDMANTYLAAARVLADESSNEPDSIIKPLSCLLLSVCSLESFINQIAFFLCDATTHGSQVCAIPPELSIGALEFQRHTELTLKWDILGKALCGRFWVIDENLVRDFHNMIYLRNEFTHYKSSAYEQIVPPPTSPNPIMSRIVKSVQIRDVLRAWPFRILTPSFAKWCETTGHEMIDSFKMNYKQSRLDSLNK
ncbi:tetratricopeptide repeat protein [Chloroflexota bacterium]